MNHSARTRSITISGLDGHEVFCLGRKGYTPGPLVVGNSVQSLGFIGGMSAGLRNLAGGESADLTRIISEGRHAALERMALEAKQVDAQGVSGVASELASLRGNVEFLSTGSAVFSDTHESFFTSSFDGKEMYCAVDAGYRPIRFGMGNIAYSVGVGSGLLGSLKSLARGEIKEFSAVLNETRHTAFKRLVAEAVQTGGNAVIGVEVDVLPLAGFHEMLVTGTIAHHPSLGGTEVITCDLTADEMWSLALTGYVPVHVVMGTAVYSLGVVGGLTAALRGLSQGEVKELTTLVYDAREHALDLMEAEARKYGADRVLGTDVFVHEMPSGLLEFMAIGTAVQKHDRMKPTSDALPVQATAVHRRTFRNSFDDFLRGANQRV